MNWKHIILDIQSRHGLTQTEIAKIVGCGQATVNGLVNEKTSQPGYALGAALLELQANKPKLVA